MLVLFLRYSGCYSCAMLASFMLYSCVIHALLLRYSAAILALFLWLFHRHHPPLALGAEEALWKGVLLPALLPA